MELKNNKSILILKCTKDICGNEVGLIQHHCQLLKMNVVVEEVYSKEALQKIAQKQFENILGFDYIYLCTHGNKLGFLVNMGEIEEQITWSTFSQLICENSILNEDSIILLSCCKGGLFQVATDILSVCNKVNFICGVKWNVEAWDLTTGFVVFIHNLEIKKSEPSYAAQKASLATDYTFTCYDRDEIEINPNYQQRQLDLYYEIGWVDKDGNWIQNNANVIENTGTIQITHNLVSKEKTI